tara:strand:- start:802 stop:1041 length:240 start_codon:yes stop_codon:yes gene_type:complete
LNIIPATTPTGTVSTMYSANSSNCFSSITRVVQLTNAPSEQLPQKLMYCRHNGLASASAKVIRRFQKKFQVMATAMPTR